MFSVASHYIATLLFVGILLFNNILEIITRWKTDSKNLSNKFIGFLFSSMLNWNSNFSHIKKFLHSTYKYFKDKKNRKSEHIFYGIKFLILKMISRQFDGISVQSKKKNWKPLEECMDFALTYSTKHIQQNIFNKNVYI